MSTEQLRDIVTPHEHDVLSGRGNYVNYHAGNEHFRSLVRKHKVDYVACPKPQKGRFSKLIYDEIRGRDPPGRFLKQDAKTKLWHDIGEKKALDKTRQALREGAPDIMKELSGDPTDEASDEEEVVGADHQQATLIGISQEMPQPHSVHSAVHASPLPAIMLGHTGQNMHLTGFNPSIERNTLLYDNYDVNRISSDSILATGALLDRQQQLTHQSMVTGIGLGQLVGQPLAGTPASILGSPLHMRQSLSHHGMHLHHLQQPHQSSSIRIGRYSSPTGLNLPSGNISSNLVSSMYSELELLQAKISNMTPPAVHNDTLEPRPIDPSVSIFKGYEPQKERSAPFPERVAVSGLPPPKRVPLRNLKRETSESSLHVETIFVGNRSSHDDRQEKIKLAASSSHMSVMSLSIGEISTGEDDSGGNDGDHLAPLLNTSLRVSDRASSHGKTTYGKGPPRRLGSNDGSTGDIITMDMSTATLGDRWSDLGESVARMSESQEMSFANVFDDTERDLLQR